MDFLEIVNKDQNLAIFVQMAGLKETDVHLIQSAAPQALALLPEVVALFLQHLKAVPEVEQRLATAHQDFPRHLTHWLGNLFTGPHDQQFLEAQHQEGSNNVQKRIPPLYTAFAMSFLRAALPQLFRYPRRFPTIQRRRFNSSHPAHAGSLSVSHGPRLYGTPAGSNRHLETLLDRLMTV